MRPILFTLFGFPIRAYGVFIAIALLAGIALAKRVAARRRPAYIPLIEEFALLAFVSAIAGARIWEVIFTWGNYRENLWEIFAVWHGGLSIQGAVVGGGLAALWFVRKHKISFWDFADVLTPGVLLGQAIGRLGSCFLNGDAYGKPTGTSFGVVYAPGTPAYSAFGPVPLWPAEVFEGLWDLAVMALALWLLKRGRPAGFVFLTGTYKLHFIAFSNLSVADTIVNNYTTKTIKHAIKDQRL